MSTLEHKSYGISFAVSDGWLPRRFKQYTRNGKTFWRDYKRDVEGGITIAEFIKDRIHWHAEYLTQGIHNNVFLSETPKEKP